MCRVGFQWEAAHNPAIVGKVFQDDEDGAALGDGNSRLAALMDKIGGDVCVYLKDCPSTSPPSVEQVGVIKLTIGGKTYKAVFGVYDPISNQIQLEDIPTLSLSDINPNHKIQDLPSSFEQLILIKKGTTYIPCTPESAYGDFCSKSDISTDAEFLSKWANDIANCFSSTSNIVNLTTESIPADDLIWLDNLLKGNNTITDEKGVQHHTSKAVLVYTNDQSDLDYAQSFVPADGAVKIWVHKGASSYELRSDLPDFVTTTMGLSVDAAKQAIKETILDQIDKTIKPFDFITTALYDFYDAAAKNIRSYRIPEYVWYRQSLNYKPAYFYAYQWFIAPVKDEGTKYKSLFDMATKEELARVFPHMKTALDELGTPETDFAFYCGIWNGLVETVAFLPAMTSVVYGALSEKGQEDIKDTFNLMANYVASDGQTGFWAAIRDGFKTATGTGDKLAELGGEIVFVALLEAVDPSAVAALSPQLAKVVQILKYLNNFDTALKDLNIVRKFTPDGIAVLYQAEHELARITDSRMIGTVFKQDTKELLALPASSTIDNIVLQSDGKKLFAIADGKTYQLVDQVLVTRYSGLTAELKNLIDNFGFGSLKLAENGSDIVFLANNGTDEVARIVDNKLVPKRFISSGTDIGSSVDNLHMVKNGDNYGFRIADTSIPIRGVNFTDFKASVNGGFPNPNLADESFYLFSEKKWGDLENLFKDNNLNKVDGVIYPPNDGFIGHTIGSLEAGAKIDRYGGYIDESTGVFKDNGKFLANDGEALTNRALPAGSDEKIYSQYEVLKDIPNTKRGEAIPWFGEKGTGIQYQVTEGVDDLIEGGYLRRISAETSDGVLLPLGRGSTGRTLANNLSEELAMKEILSNPTAGQIIPDMPPLTDQRWLGWRKMQYIKSLSDGTNINIHFVGNWEDDILVAVDDFKFK